MKIFSSFGGELSYRDGIQLDGAFSVSHINYGKSPIFNEEEAKEIASNSRKGSLSSAERIDDVPGSIYLFNGTEKNFKQVDKVSLWQSFWLEYTNAFDKLAHVLPSSIATVFLARHAVEIGFKYLLLKKTGDFPKVHDLGQLSRDFFVAYSVGEGYMDDIAIFCDKYCAFIEGGNAEYFRFPEYKGSTFFAGNSLDIKWLSFNFALILLKLIHFADLEDEINAS